MSGKRVYQDLRENERPSLAVCSVGTHRTLRRLILDLFVSVRKCVEAGITIEASVRAHADYPKEIFFDWAVSVRESGLNASAVGAQVSGINPHCVHPGGAQRYYPATVPPGAAGVKA